MNDWRKVLVIVGLLGALALPAFADIGENFERGGIGFGGAAAFYYDFSYFLDSTNQYRYWYLDVYPRITFLLVDNLALQLEPSFYYRIQHNDKANIYRRMFFGLSGSVTYYLVPDPRAMQGLVPAFGLGLGVTIEPGVDDLVGGATQVNNYLYTDATVGPRFALYYFLTDRFSPYVSVQPTLYYTLSAQVSGAPLGLTAAQRALLRLNAYVGFTYHVPNKDYAVVKIE